ncbi:pyridoxamine 5'-phosphate oxidase family protein [Massilia sp. LXY-6]|uniref:pyridoxamine 5'-phosphate oxidase family protein n=1 Tax=Massilia sp. LXY-6 TaxID=3379823 RepID=UPI003EDF9502
MEQEQQAFVLRVLDTAQDLTLATIRPDGYPQATTVSFAHENMLIYVGIGRHSQKADNIRGNGKVSLTINLPYHDWREIRGLSMSASAELLDDPREAAEAAACLERRFPAVSEWCGPDMAHEVAFVRIRPQMVSVIDYSKGFGHTELVST